jgi:hypothetical protein
VTIDAANRPAGGVWQAPVALSDVEEKGRQGQVAIDASGDAVAAWSGFNGSNSLVQAAGYSATGPRLSEAVSFTVSPLSIWSTVGDTNWRFGDSSAAVGTDVTHTYAKAGSYTVTVESEDVLGNATKSSGQITIAPRIDRPEYQNWTLTGAIYDKRRGQAIALPQGSTFNGNGELNTETGTGSITGSVSLPPFKAGLKLFDILPVEVGLTLAEVGQLEGSISPNEAAPRTEALGIPLKLHLGITSLSMLGLTIPVACASSAPIVLDLADTLSDEAVLSGRWSFIGGTAIPRLNCQHGFLAPLVGLLVTSLLSGPEDAYALSFAPSDR